MKMESRYEDEWEICSYCGRIWVVDDEGRPRCCVDAIIEWDAEQDALDLGEGKETER